jgi:hypothetical protein
MFGIASNRPPVEPIAHQPHPCRIVLPSTEAPAAGVEHLLTYGGDRGYVNNPCQRAKSARARRAAATSATAPRSQRQPITSAR